MSKHKSSDLVCVCIVIFSLVLTIWFMNAEKFGVTKVEADQAADNEQTFSQRDYEETWKEQKAVRIQLDDMEKLTTQGAYVLDGDLYIIQKGTYVLSGQLENHQVRIHAKGEKIQLVLDGVQIQNVDGPAIFVEKADKVFLTLAENSENVITAEFVDEEAAKTGTEDGQSEVGDAAVYSTSDLTVNGSGSLKITSQGGHGIKSKDDLVITNGNYVIDADQTALLGKDSVRIADGSFLITAGADGIKANNDTDDEKGYVKIVYGSFEIQADDDGIQAETTVEIDDGTFQITTGGGASNAEQRQEEFGDFGGGSFGGGGFEGKKFGRDDHERGDFGDGKNPFEQRGQKREGMTPPDGMEMPEGMTPPDGMEMPEGMTPPDGMEMPEGMTPPDGMEMPERMTPDSTSASDSFKGIKAGKDILILGGQLELNCRDDALHSDGELWIQNGTIVLAAGDDGIHADEFVRITAGDILISGCYEGIEGKQILIEGGMIDLTSSDDGMNASDGAGEFGFGFRQAGNTDDLPVLRITGGQISVHANGDGLDSNGDVIIDGGDIIVDGPANSANGALDSGSENGGDLVVNGGTVLALGASGMAENFSENSTQYSFHCIFDSNYVSGDLVQIKDSDGNLIHSYEIKKSGNSLIFSSELLKKGETYTVIVGDQSQEITIESISNGENFSMGWRKAW